MDQMIHSAALYCAPDSQGYISLHWLDGALHLFESYGVQVRAYGLGENAVCSSGIHTLGKNDSQLRAAVRSGVLRFLELYSHSVKRLKDVVDWEATAIINLSKGDVQFGLPARCGILLPELIRRTYALAKPLAAWRYGIGYVRAMAKSPSFYAVGVLGGSAYPYADESQEDLDRVGAWLHEKLGRKRYLHGYLRDVYPVNLLSEEHVNARIGKKKLL